MPPACRTSASRSGGPTYAPRGRIDPRQLAPCELTRRARTASARVGRVRTHTSAGCGRAAAAHEHRARPCVRRGAPTCACWAGESGGGSRGGGAAARG
eukprot:433600-Prymnesium_polylepis.1